MTEQEYLEAVKAFETFDARVENPSLSITDAWSEELASRARTKRDELLRASDWTQLPDSPVNVTTWATYRQSLRDVTSQIEFPLNITWPASPTL